MQLRKKAKNKQMRSLTLKPTKPPSTSSTEQQQQQQQTPKRAKSTFPFGKCKVCNDKATGVHYGVASCEGCKVSIPTKTTTNLLLEIF